MPIYEYRCYTCRKTFEMLQRISSEPLQSCIHCGGPVEKLISAPSFQFKGEGWYVTDYKKKSKPDRETASEPPKKDSDNGKKKKTDE